MHLHWRFIHKGFWTNTQSQTVAWSLEDLNVTGCDEFYIKYNLLSVFDIWEGQEWVSDNTL